MEARTLESACKLSSVDEPLGSSRCLAASKSPWLSSLADALIDYHWLEFSGFLKIFLFHRKV